MPQTGSVATVVRAVRDADYGVRTGRFFSKVARQPTEQK
jgi:hypothetical protein